MVTTVLDGTPPEAVTTMREREAANSRRLAEEGSLRRLWRPPLAEREWRSWGIFSAADAEALEAVLATMPLRAWREDAVTPLTPHPNDSGLGRPS